MGNPNHPLYLHHANQPGLILVLQPFVEDNYGTWGQSMTMALMVKNKIGFVDKSIKEPSRDEPDELQQWKRCNNLVKTWLLGSMSKKIASNIICCKDACQMWLDLQERFSHVNTVQLFHIKNEIHDCIRRNITVSSYFTKLESLWDERDALCSIPTCCCGTIKEIAWHMETQETMKFLIGLNESYATVRGNTLLLEPLPIVNKAYSLFLRHERQAEVSNRKASVQLEAIVFAVKNSSPDPESAEKGLQCAKCNRTNHNTKNCRAHPFWTNSSLPISSLITSYVCHFSDSI